VTAGRVLLVSSGFGPHMGPRAVQEAASRGLDRAGWDVVGAPLWLGEPGTVEGMVRLIGGRVHTMLSRGGPVRYGRLLDGTAIVDRTAVREHTTETLALVVRRVLALRPRRVLLALGGVRHSDFGRGLYQGLGVKPEGTTARENLPIRTPVTYLVLEPNTMPVASVRAREWVSRLEAWRGRPVGHYSGELGPALAALGADARPAASYLLHHLKLAPWTETVDWILTAVPTVGPVGYGGLVPWAGETARRARRPTWVLAGSLAKGYQDVYRLGPVGLYPLLDQVQTERQAERRAVTMVEQAAYRLGVIMAATLAQGATRRHERSDGESGLRDPHLDGGSEHQSGRADAK
jgi:glycerate kinase